jgi:hypothetical protein
MERNGEPSAFDAAAEPLAWVRKRDKRMAPFDPTKVASSVLAAHRRVDPENPAFVAQELADAVLHFLAEEFAGAVLTTQDVSETVMKVLREMGHAATAQVYHAYAARRAALREGCHLVEAGDDGLGTGGQPAAVGWNKGAVAERLEAEADLDPQAAREVAAAVEARLLQCRLAVLTSGLIDELVHCELIERGIDRRWGRRMPLGVAAHAILDSVDSQLDPTAIAARVGEKLLEGFGRREVFSRDVAGLLDEGILRLLAGASPVHWSLAVVRFGWSPEPASAIDAFLRRCREAARRCQHAVAVHGLPWTVEGLESPSRLRSGRTFARRFVEALVDAAADGRRRWIVNVGGVGDAQTAPMFDEEVDPSADGLAEALCDELGKRAAEAGLADRLRVDLHVRPDWGRERIASRLRPALRGMRRGLSVAVVVDSAATSPAEGLFGASQRESGVFQYIGVDLEAILNRLGNADADTFLRRLALIADSAVRAGVQKREFLRRASRIDEDGVVVLAPLGLAPAVLRVTSRRLQDADPAAAAFAGELLRRLRERAAREARHYQLHCRVDGTPWEAPMIDADEWTGDRAPAVRRRTAGVLVRLAESVGGGAIRLCVRGDGSERDLSEVLADFAARAAGARVVVCGPRPARQGRLFEA